MAAQQLELDFESAIALARQDPFQMELKALLGQFEPSLEGLEREDKLRLAGNGLVAMAEVLQQKAEAMYEDWCDRHNDEGPIPNEDFLAGLVQETMFLDVSGVVRSPKGRKKVESDEEGIDSSVAEMDKEELLLLLEAADVEVDPEPSLSVDQLEYDENIGAWIELIRDLMIKYGNDVLFSELVRQNLLPQGKAWLAVLLGGFQLEHSGDFYLGIVRVRSR